MALPIVRRAGTSSAYTDLQAQCSTLARECAAHERSQEDPENAACLFLDDAVLALKDAVVAAWPDKVAYAALSWWCPEAFPQFIEPAPPLGGRLIDDDEEED